MKDYSGLEAALAAIEQRAAETFPGISRIAGFGGASDIRAQLGVVTDLVFSLTRALREHNAQAKEIAAPVTDEQIEAVARAIARGCNLDPDAFSPKTAAAGHSIPEWMFFTIAAKNVLELVTIDERGAVIDTCEEGGHRFAKLPDHPARDGRPRCPHCMAIGLGNARSLLQEIVYAWSNADAPFTPRMPQFCERAMRILADLR